MAETKKNAADLSQNLAVPKEKSKTTEIAYPVKELVDASEGLFKVKKECAAAALKPMKAKEMTVKEAAVAVEKFMKKEVK